MIYHESQSNCRQFTDIRISQGSVATYSRCDHCDTILKYEFVANLWVCRSFGKVTGNSSLVACFLNSRGASKATLSLAVPRDIVKVGSCRPTWCTCTSCGMQAEAVNWDRHRAVAQYNSRRVPTTQQRETARRIMQWIFLFRSWQLRYFSD